MGAALLQFCHFDRASLLNWLGVRHVKHFEQTGHLGYLNKGIQLNREALLLRPVGHPHRVSSLNDLSVCLSYHFQYTGRPEDLDEPIQLDREALLLHPEGHPDHGFSLNNLSVDLLGRFEQTGHLEDLDESIQLNRKALLLRPVGHPSRGASLNNLSMGLSSRFQQTGRLEDLNESIQLNRDTLLLCPVGHPDRGSSLNNLGVGLGICFKHTGLEDLDESIQLNREALLLHPVGHRDRHSSLNNLSVGLHDRFGQTGHLEDLNESIQLARDALLLRPVGHPARGSSLNNLSVRVRIRCRQTGHEEDLTEFLSAVKEAAEDICSPVSDRLMAVQNWVLFTQPHHDLARSNLDAYITGLSLISLSLSMTPIISLQYQHLLSFIKLPEFVSDGASQAIQLGQLGLAVEMIEQGRGLLWSELRGLQAPMDRIQALDPSLVDELVQDPFGHNLSEKRRLLHAQSDIIKRIHKIPGFETFLGRKSFDELKSAAKHGPVIVINCSRYKSDVLVIEEHNLVWIPMVRGFYEEVKTLVQRLTEAKSYIKAAPKRYNHVLRETLQDLWDLVVSHVVAVLHKLHVPEKSRIFWCPTSILSTLPLHAAGPVSPGTKKFLPDLYISSYTPTLTALITAFNTTKSSSQVPHLLVAGQYDKSLRRTEEEIHEVLQYQKHMHTTSLEGPTATKEALEKALVDHEWLHIASHGTLVPGNPFSSYFSLAGGSRFTLLDIIRLNLPNATFAFLSACHTAEQSPDSIHDEVIHLAAAMQFCGFRSVVGTMWEMADVDGPEMAKDFYSYLFSDENLSRCNEVGAQARALSDAVRKMRERKGVTLERWVNFVHIGA
ncbi:CHAT domain-containing protein [Rhodocollybia butyracea]|uniref:CHAT domain-containing protein n=1 Tax=Rhodocollybia butyracea TaxID=206335 RepID=A0A9P5PH01_9AGAR|nr:CHAT domain-containing protein [Rhodocollybia butyracea]